MASRFSLLVLLLLSAPCFLNMAIEGQQPERIKVILDTDIGGDIDDVLALAFALKLQRLDVVGITLALDGNLRAPVALKMLKLLGRQDVPVALGSHVRLLRAGQPATGADGPQMKAVGDTSGLPEPIRQHAVDFIIDKVMSSREGEITLVPYGPLTNIAMAIAKEPRVVRKVREIVLMGGTLSHSWPEYNVWADPEAAAIVFSSGAQITMVGLDVTLKCKMTAEQIEAIRMRGRADTDQLYRFITAWQQGRPDRMPILHDPLAVAVAADRSLVTVKRMIINVETRGEFTAGATVPKRGASGAEIQQSKIQVCTDVNADRFLALFMDTILK